MFYLHKEWGRMPCGARSTVLAAALSVAGCDSNEMPVPKGSIPGQTVAVGETVTISLAQYFSDADGDPLVYDATSGAPTVATANVSGESLSVAGVFAGSATVNVTATDVEGLSARQSFVVTVPNRAPVASSQIPDAELHVGESVQVDVSEHFSDPDGDALSFTVASSDDGVVAASASGAVVRLAGVSQGTASVTVTATDPGGLSAEQTFAVTVPNRAPVASSQIPDAEVHVGESVGVDVSEHFGDPDGDALSFTAASSDDGVVTASASGAVVRVAGVGQGTASVTVTATDPGGLSVEQSFAVTVPNRAPVASSQIPDAEVHVGESVGVDVSERFSDPDGDALSFTAASSDDGVVTASASGAVVRVAGVGQGTASVTVTATDPGGLSVEQSFAVTVPNRAPVASSQIPDAEVHVGESVQLDVSERFGDPDGDALSFTAASSDDGVVTASASGAVVRVAGVGQGTASVTVTATDPGGLSVEQSFAVTVPNRAPVASSQIPDAEVHVGESVQLDVSERFGDPDGDALSFTAASSDDGVVTASASGAVVRVAGVGQGTASVTVTATDPGGLSVEQTFAVAVPNRAPVASSQIPDAEIDVGESVQLDVSERFGDPDGDALSFTASSDDDGVVTASATGAVVRVAGVGQGTASVTVTATDPGGLSATQEIEVTVVQPNRAPVPVGEIAPASMFKDEEFAEDLSRFFADPDGDALAYMARSSDAKVVAVRVEGDSMIVKARAQGVAKVTVTATDPDGLSATQATEVTVENRAPEVEQPIPSQRLEVGGAVTLDVEGYFSDPDGDGLSYAAASADTLLAVATVDGAEVEITGTGAGDVAISITATDPGGLSATQEIEVTVEEPNRAPVPVGEIAPVSLFKDEEFAEDLSRFFADPDGDALAYAARSSDATVVAVGVEGDSMTVTAVAQGEATVTVTATDPGGLSATQTTEVTVPNRAPVLVGEIAPASVFKDDEFTVDPSRYFTDPDGDALTYSAGSSDATVVAASVEGDSMTVTAVAQGEATVTVTATDPGGLSATQTTEVTVPNRAPVPVGEIAPASVFKDDEFTVDPSRYFTDPDGDALAYAARSSDTTVVAADVEGDSIIVAAVAQGEATVTVTATDPYGLSATQTTEVTVPNRAPEPVGEIAPVSAFKDDEFTMDLSRFFTDPDGDALAYAVRSSDTTVVAAGVEGDSATVTAVAQGEAEITVTATDPYGLSATQTAAVTVKNRAPEPVGEMEPVSMFLGGEVADDVSRFFADPDGDALSYAARSSDTTVVAVAVEGDSMTVTAVTRGEVEVTVTATDPYGLSATQTAEVTVENRAPEAVGELEDDTLATGDTAVVDLTGLFTDPDGDSLAYAAESTDDSVATAEANGLEVTITATGGGVATVTVIATDPGGLSDSLQSSVVVNNPPVAGDTLPIHDLFIVVEDADSDPDTLSKVVIDVSDYFSDPDGDELTYSASTEDDSVAEVESVSGSVITTAPVEVDTASLWDSTTITVTATDPHGLSVSQEAQVRVAHADYGEWSGLRVTESGTFVLSGLPFSGCFTIDGFVYGDTVYTVHRSEWQRQEGTGWVQLAETYKELEVCAYDDLPDEPAGVYRLVGEVTTWPSDTADTDEGDTVRALRKSENTIEIEENVPPPPFASALDRPLGVGEPLRSRGLVARYYPRPASRRPASGATPPPPAEARRRPPGRSPRPGWRG